MTDTIVKGILCDYLGKSFTKAKMEQATIRIAEALAEKLKAQLDEQLKVALADALDVELEKLVVAQAAKSSDSNKESDKAKSSKKADAPKKEEPKKDPYAGTRVKGIISMPDVGEGGDSGPVSIRVKK